MSAFMCSDDHLRILALAAACGDLEEARRHLVTLYQANRLSLYARYDDPFDPEDKGPSLQRHDAVRIKALGLSPVAIIKLAWCFEYQSCEHRDWRASDARELVIGIVGVATRELPGYSDAAWGYR